MKHTLTRSLLLPSYPFSFPPHMYIPFPTAHILLSLIPGRIAGPLPGLEGWLSRLRHRPQSALMTSLDRPPWRRPALAGFPPFWVSASHRQNEGESMGKRGVNSACKPMFESVYNGFRPDQTLFQFLPLLVMEKSQN